MMNWNYSIYHPRSQEHEKIMNKLKSLYQSNPLLSSLNWYRLSVLFKTYNTVIVEAPDPFIMLFSKKSRSIELIHPFKQSKPYFDFLHHFMLKHDLVLSHLPHLAKDQHLAPIFFEEYQKDFVKFITQTPPKQAAVNSSIKELTESSFEDFKTLLMERESGSDQAHSMYHYLLDTPLLNHYSSGFIHTPSFHGFALTQFDPEVHEGSIDWLHYSEKNQIPLLVKDLLHHSTQRLFSVGAKFVTLTLSTREGKLLEPVLLELGFQQQQEFYTLKKPVNT